MLQDIRHVFKDEAARTLYAEDLVDFKEEGALERVGEAHLVAGFGERLARKTSS